MKLTMIYKFKDGLEAEQITSEQTHISIDLIKALTELEPDYTIKITDEGIPYEKKVNDLKSVEILLD